MFDASYKFAVGKGSVIRKGNDVAVISIGSIINEAIDAAAVLESEGISVGIINMPMVKPIDLDLVCSAVRETKLIITLEEHSIYGGLGSAVAECIAERGLAIKLIRMGLDCIAVGCGKRDEIREINHLSSKDVIETIKKHF